MLINLILILSIYFPALKSFFFMDDFYFLSISRANSLSQFVSLFMPIKFVPYRPISQQLFFFSFQKIFGFNPLPFHLFILLIHLINSLLVNKIFQKLIANKTKARLLSIFYLISPLYFVGLYSITGSYLIFGTLFFLLSLWFWLKFTCKYKIRFFLLSFFTFILGIFSAEIVIVLPFIIILISNLKNIKKYLIPYFLAILCNLYINFFFAGAPEDPTFKLLFSNFFPTFRWYILRAFGLPEGIKNGFWIEQFLIYLLFIILIALFLYSFYKNRKHIIKNFKNLLKFMIWILIGSLPFYFMPNHLNPLYFSISFIGFLLILEIILNKKIFTIYIIISIILSVFSTQLLMRNHWTVRRAQLAKNWLIGNLVEYKDLKNKEIFINAPNKETLDELKITFLDDLAFKLLYYTKDIKVIYEIRDQ